MDHQLAKKTSEIKQSKSEAIRKEEMIDTLKKEATEKLLQLREQAAALKDLDAKCLDKDSQINKFAESITKLQKKFDEKGSQVANIQAQPTASDDPTPKSDDQASKISGLEARIRDLNDEIKALTSENESLKVEVVNATQLAANAGRRELETAKRKRGNREGEAAAKRARAETLVVAGQNDIVDLE